MEPFRQGSRVLGRAPLATSSVVKRFDQPERVLVFDRGRLELITLGGMAIGKGSFAPGFRWSRCVPPAGSPLARSEAPEQIGVVLSGRAKAAVHEGAVIDLMAGDFFHVVRDFDECVVMGYRPCEILYLSGVEALIRQLHRA